MDKEQKNSLSLGLGGVFRGLSDLLQIAVEIAESDDASGMVEARRGASIGSPKGLHAVYGVSVRIGARGAPVVARFGNVRQNADSEPIVDAEWEPLVDVLDEEDHYLVVAELPGIGFSEVVWNVREGVSLEIRGSSADRRYRRRIRLVEPVEEHTSMSCYENGVLQLKLWKQRR